MEIIPSNNKKNHTISSSILSTSIGLAKYYISNSFQKITNKIYSIYSNSPTMNNKNINHSDSIQDINNNNNNNDKENISNLNIKNNSDNNLNIENELLIFNNSQIKKNIYIFLENELQINNIKLELRNSNNQILQIQKYNEFKNKIIIHFFSSIIILKYYNIISITSLCAISLMKKIKIGNIYSNIIINNKQISLILDSLWNISNQTSKNIYSNLSEIIYNKVDKIPLNEKYNKDKFINLFDTINNEIKDKCNFFIYIIKILKEQHINNLENQFFDKNSVQNNNLYEYKLKFFYIFCDIMCTDIFYSSFVQSYEEEIKRQMEEIKGNFGELNEKTLLAIIYDLDSYKSKQFINYENYDLINSDTKTDENDNKDKDRDNILMNYQISLQSIDI